MTTPETCPACQAPLAPGTDPAQCPRCLLGVGQADGGGAATGGADDAPVAAALAAQFPELEILEVVGRGGMGVVYRVRQKALNRTAALKVLPESLRDEPGFAERFAREARTMARLDHAHIVRVHDFGERDGRFFLLMEYIDGASLRRVIDVGGLKTAEALRIVPQICEALQYAHDAGVVHRDIKPGNVLISKDGDVKVTDFGLAKLLDHEAAEHTLTQTGQVMGTLHYMAPEQYRTPEEVDHRADIYSLGVVFYEMLTGEVPMGNFEPPSQRVEVDVRLDSVVLRTLERERGRRYQRADELRTEVATIVDHPVGDAQPASVGRNAQPEPRLSRTALWGFLCLPATFVVPVLLALVSGAMFSWASAAVVIGSGVLLLGVGFFLSLVGWIQIARSRGALKGLGFAVTGTVAPLPLLFVMVIFLFFGAREASHDEIHQGFEQTRPVRQHAAWNRLAEAVSDGQVSRDELSMLVADLDRRRVDLMRTEDRERLAARGLLGPVYMAPDSLPDDLHAMSREGWEVTSGPVPLASLLMARGEERVTVRLVKAADTWMFALAPVLTTPAATLWAQSELVSGPHTDAVERRAIETDVETLWSIYRAFWEAGSMPLSARIPQGQVSALLAPSARAANTTPPADLLAEQGRAGALGLLFLDAKSLPGRLGDYDLTAIELAPDVARARVSLRAGDAEVLFDVVRERGRWWFAATPVTVTGR